MAAGAALALLVAGALVVVPRDAATAAEGIVDVGAGGYAATPVGPTPEGCDSIEADPRAALTDDAPQGPLPTNDWWSSLLYKRLDCRMSEPLHAHPASYQPTPAGLGLSTPRVPTISGTPGGIGEFHYMYEQDVLVGVAGLDAPTVQVAGWTDWTVTPFWTDGTRSLRATIGHGLPTSWYHLEGGDALLTSSHDVSVWSDDGATLGFTANGHDYAAFAPTGSTWQVSGSTMRSSLAGEGYLAVTALATAEDATDADRAEALAAVAGSAFAEVTSTVADYEYDAADGVVRTTYQVGTTPLEGDADGAVVALYPHQQRYVTDVEGVELDTTYVSPRGSMTAYAGTTSFTTTTPFTGILPEIPAVATSTGTARETLDGLLAEAAADPMPILRGDTYWTGKALGRATRIVEIADQLGESTVRDETLAHVRDTLTEWFTATPGKADQVFAYDERWGTLIGYPASYGSDTELNDHHFHYGYFIAAAATLARFDPEWASDEQYGGMVDLLIRDANNYDRDETLFPYMRDFDIYAGHDWASGHGAFFAGNNQESSSEGQNFAGALVQWGEATGDTAVRDAGAYLYATQAAAIQEYWFDQAEAIPDGFGHSTLGMVWGDGGTYSTWFSADPEMIQGINTLPITGSHLYLGLRPDDVVSNYAELVRANGGQPTVWQDLLWSYLALGDGEEALRLLQANPGYAVEEGESRVHTYHWIANLAALGTLDTSVHGSSPLSAVFVKDGERTYVAANVSASERTVRFSDGTELVVPAGKTVTTGAYTWSGGGAQGGPDPTSSPTPTPTPTPSVSPTPTPTPSTSPTPTPTPSVSPTPTPTPTPSVSPTPTPTPSTSPTPTPTPTVTPDPTEGLDLAFGPDGTLVPAPGADGSFEVAPSRGVDTAAEPPGALVFQATGLTASATGGTTAFDIALDAGNRLGNGTRLSVQYDLTGDGTWDRVEVYRYFATDPIPGAERYTQAVGLDRATGTLGDLRGGTVRVALWNAIGSSASTVLTGDSVLELPFD
ncbi:glycosyl hydrolase [Cellulomonas sp. S1-8]|uniref:glycosyl hydrolase n=1 Tax=Cellulomonas sp. S1-8 TaxID=2904790 RepID=UPI002242EFF9|nr:glycosyl hydrolase [Cellulomonas sp. S1-8]UZN04696.1 glycosyl hydrolase [Cellulomonas sp. S1-8]